VRKSFTARTSSHTNFPLCTLLICKNTHTASEGRVGISNTAPAGGRFGEQKKEARGKCNADKPQATTSKSDNVQVIHTLLWFMERPSAATDPAHTHTPSVTAQY